jgi:hypothetical protein
MFYGMIRTIWLSNNRLREQNEASDGTLVK